MHAVEKPLLAPASAVYIHDDGVIAKSELGDLHLSASVNRCSMRGHSPVQKILVQWLLHVLQKSFLTRRQRFGGFRKFARNVTNQFQLRIWLKCCFLRARRGGRRLVLVFPIIAIGKEWQLGV